MNDQKTIQTKASVKASIRDSFAQVASQISNLSSEQLHFKPDGKWSPAENLSHLISSTFPIASALNKTKLMFRVFGTSSNGSRTYGEMNAFYREKLTGGIGTAGTGFEPKSDDIADVEKMLENWKMIGAKFESRIEKWSESDLDKYRLPHPLLGKLTFREMLFFTHFHNLIHLEIIKQRISEHGEI